MSRRDDSPRGLTDPIPVVPVLAVLAVWVLGLAALVGAGYAVLF